MDIIEMLRKLGPDDGMTLKNFIPICYKTGWQVATDGVVVKTPEEAYKAILQYRGNCGVWVNPEDGTYCVDLSHRVTTKREAMEIGIKYHQYSVLRWRDMQCIKCQ